MFFSLCLLNLLIIINNADRKNGIKGILYLTNAPKLAVVKPTINANIILNTNEKTTKELSKAVLSI